MLSLVCVVVASKSIKVEGLRATPVLIIAAGKPEDPCGILGEAIHEGGKRDLAA